MMEARSGSEDAGFGVSGGQPNIEHDQQQPPRVHTLSRFLLHFMSTANCAEN